MSSDEEEENPMILKLLFNKTAFFLKKKICLCELGLFGSFEFWKNAEFLILSGLKVLYKCQNWVVKIWDTALLLSLWEIS